MTPEGSLNPIDVRQGAIRIRHAIGRRAVRRFLLQSLGLARGAFRLHRCDTLLAPVLLLRLAMGTFLLDGRLGASLFLFFLCTLGALHLHLRLQEQGHAGGCTGGTSAF
jgi:hypothetical protein